MGKAYILVILVCTALGFLYCGLVSQPHTDVHYNLNAIALGAAWIGGIYAFAGVLVGSDFVRRLDQTKSKTAGFFIATPVHMVSTLVAAYVVPTAIYLVSHSTQAWLTSAFLSLFLGLPQALVDFVIFRWLFGLPLKPRQIGTIMLWKMTTVFVFMMLLVTLPTFFALTAYLH